MMICQLTFNVISYTQVNESWRLLPVDNFRQERFDSRALLHSRQLLRNSLLQRIALT